MGINLRSLRFFLARSEAACWHCGAITPVFALAVPPGFESRETDEVTPSEWMREEDGALLSYVTTLNASAQEQIARFAPHYKPTQGTTVGLTYWMNHCIHCDAKLGDHYLHSEPEGAFFPLDETQAKGITLEPLQGHLEASAGYSIGLISHVVIRDQHD